MNRYAMKYTHKSGKYLMGEAIKDGYQKNIVMLKEKDWANYYPLEVKNDSLIGAYVEFGSEILYLADFN